MHQPEFLEVTAKNKLVSKVQYQNYEPGEFTNICSRTLSETLELIAHFPWQEYRHPECIKLTGPSITVEHPAGRFLKIGPYYNKTYCLYFIDETEKLQVHIVSDLTDCYAAIKAIYNNAEPFISNQRAPFYEDPHKHFVTNSFEYTVNKNRILAFIWYPILFHTFLFLLVFTLGFTDWEVFTNLLGITIGGGIFALINGPNLYLLYNYYKHSKNLYLKLAKGQNDFYSGPKESPKKYLKEDVEVVHILSNHGSKCPWGHNTVFKIIFKNGEVLQISNLLIKTSVFTTKMPENMMEWKHKYFASI
ncbi:hypothetical protein AAE02nite_48400 [Adhaeribacter aerolatus]|uniref:PH domain-containing protein n=1 Tax=Adhaeribacter aerolatus TaxID=670289 RepID=A0A512B5D0_9BACT|nr:hypothetical protein [Adhaeribacter aerolatus]GEO07176.1 hypothetical protein AAE02nite_48400 [Adhaeribacter aerolatus]